MIGGYIVNGMKIVGDCPQTVIGDMGTENKAIERFQTSLHYLFNENVSSTPCFLYGKSVHNQKIEAWSSILRKLSAQFWMNLFQTSKDKDYFCGTFLDKCLMQFCFMDLIQVDMYLLIIFELSHIYLLFFLKTMADCFRMIWIKLF